MEHQILVDQLKESYRQIFAEQSAAGVLSWAQTKLKNPSELVSPTIPFVGKDYPAQKTKVLLYASAEKLVDRNIKYNGHIDDDGLAINRHRWYKDNVEREFFPMVHIRPIEDGCLLIVLRYICEQLGLDMPTTPKEFVESIAFANFGKFSDKTDKDYAKDKAKLDCSMPYVKRDLELLQPDIIVMFKSIYETERENIKTIKDDAQIIPLLQMNVRNINIRIKPKFTLKDKSELSPVIQDWYDARHFNQNKFTGNNHKNFLSVFTYLDSVLKSRNLIAQ